MGIVWVSCGYRVGIVYRVRRVVAVDDSDTLTDTAHTPRQMCAVTRRYGVGACVRWHCLNLCVCVCTGTVSVCRVWTVYGECSVCCDGMSCAYVGLVCVCTVYWGLCVYVLCEGAL